MKNKIFIALTVFIVCFCAFIIPIGGNTAHANSTLKYWQGVTASGAIVMDGDVPIVVEKENLTFDINEFPLQQDYYNGNSTNYTSKVTAEYVFYNPSDYEVRATLAFPYGNLPMYTNNASELEYGVKINDETIASQKRHTYNPNFNYDFDYKVAVAQIQETYKTDEFYTPDMPVYKYSYTVSDLSVGQCVVSFTVNYGSNVRYFLVNGSFKGETDKMVSYGAWVESDETVTLYVIGMDVEVGTPAFYTNFAKDAEACNGTLILDSKEEITFKDLVLSKREGSSSISEIDWYNATIDMLNNGYDLGANLNDYIMEWYQYELKISAGERVTNRVVAPLYPSINENYNPSKYDYVYLLSPAQSWASFGELTININTTAYMLKDTLGGFEKVDTGYKKVCNGLPEEELEFTLCEEKRPKRIINWSYYLLIIIPVSIVVAIIALIVVIVVVVKKKRRKKRGVK